MTIDEIIDYMSMNYTGAEHLEIVTRIIEMITNELAYCIETDQDKRELNKLTTCEIILNDLLKEIKGGE